MNTSQKIRYFGSLAIVAGLVFLFVLIVRWDLANPNPPQSAELNKVTRGWYVGSEFIVSEDWIVRQLVKPAQAKNLKPDTFVWTEEQVHQMIANSILRIN